MAKHCPRPVVKSIFIPRNPTSSHILLKYINLGISVSVRHFRLMETFVVCVWQVVRSSPGRPGSWEPGVGEGEAGAGVHHQEPELQQGAASQPHTSGGRCARESLTCWLCVCYVSAEQFINNWTMLLEFFRFVNMVMFPWCFWFTY